MADVIDVHDLSEEQVKLIQKLVEFLRDKWQTKKPERVGVKKPIKIPIHLVKADMFLKHTGIISIGGDAVKDARHYDE